MIGPDSPEQLEENLGGVGWELTDGERVANWMKRRYGRLLVRTWDDKEQTEEAQR